MRLALLCARTAVVAGLVLTAGACSTDTGVLIEVTRAEDVREPNRLVFYVGQGDISRFEEHYADFEPESDVDVAGRNLAADPYLLMLRPGGDDKPVLVVVLGYKGDELVGFGALDEAVPFVDGKITQWAVELGSEVPDGFDVGDTCLHYINKDGDYIKIGRPGDLDCDGWGSDEDCDDLAPDVNPDATDVCGNNIDEDCDNSVDENVDSDNDSVTTCDGDCNDNNRNVFPGADETCDGVDNNCDGFCDEGFDQDDDFYTACGSKLLDGGTRCNLNEDRKDCAPEDGDINPAATEVCDGVDNDCSGHCDDTEELDPDGDGYTECGSFIGVCGTSDDYVDCEPENEDVHPGAVELCNGIDDDCDGQGLTQVPCFATNPENNEQCFEGSRSCDDDEGTLGECSPEVEEATQAPIEVCEAYDVCEEDQDPDLHECALDQAGGNDIACYVNVLAPVGDQCEGREVLLPTGGSETCSWMIVGGTQQGGYFVGLRPVGGDVPGGSTDACSAVLRVESQVPVPAPVSVLLLRFDDDTGTPLRLVLDPQAVGSCKPPAGLECDGLAPVTQEI